MKVKEATAAEHVCDWCGRPISGQPYVVSMERMERNGVFTTRDRYELHPHCRDVVAERLRRVFVDDAPSEPVDFMKVWYGGNAKMRVHVPDITKYGDPLRTHRPKSEDK